MGARTVPADPVRSARAKAVDGVGLLLVALTMAWTVVASLDRPDARPGPVLALLAGTAALAAVGRRSSSPDAVLVPALVAVAVTGAVVLGYPAILRAGGAPTGYANANATLVALGAIASAAAASVSRPGRQRQAWAALAVVLATTVISTGSMAASALLGIVTALAIGSVLTRQVAVAVVGGLVAVSLTLGVTVAIAAGGDPLDLRSRDEVRSALWSRALDQVRDEPLRGVGPGRSAPSAPSAIDADLRWAHHGYLQQAAEEGVPGLVLLLGVVGWGYACLWCGRGRPTARTLLGATALTVVAVHASVDHVLHHAAVPLTLAVLVGWATADPPDR
jgi:O-antigen ligase